MQPVTINPGLEMLVCRLAPFWAPTAPERQALAGVLGGQRVFAPREALLHEHRAQGGLLLLVEGFACRFRMLPDGRRQILGFLLPGDLCDLRLLLLGRLDHSVAALGAVRASLLPGTSLAGVMDRHPRLARALWWRAAADDAVAYQWLLNVGYRPAQERVAHLLCELYWRLEALGLAHAGECRLPLTQTELGDAVALSAVHINRTLMAMRRAGLVQLHGGRLQLLDRAGLQRAAGFDPGYLHLHAGEPEWRAEGDALSAQSARIPARSRGFHNTG